MEATKNTAKTYAEMEPYNVRYYIAKYGTVENLTKDYEGAIGCLRMQYKQYEDNPRKGGRYRREKMEHIRQQAEAIFDELLRVSKAMKEYLVAQATETPQISTGTADVAEYTADSDCRVCSHCGKRFHEGYFLGDEYACSDECAVALYGGDREQFEADLEAEEEEAGTTECYWSTW